MINLFRLTSFRLIFIYTILLVVSVFLIAFYLHLSTARDLKNRVDEDIIKESKMLIRVYQRGGVNRLARSIAQLSQIPNANLYALRNNNNDIVAGNFKDKESLWNLKRLDDGWVSFSSNRNQESINESLLMREQFFRGKEFILQGSFNLIIGRDVSNEVYLWKRFLTNIFSATFFVLILGLFGGFVLSRNILSRISAINRTSIEIMDGDLSQRLPVGSMKDVSDNIAHDLRTPLNKIRTNLEVTLMSNPTSENYKNTIQEVIQDIDVVINTFNSLLAISRVESGSLSLDKEKIDINNLIENVIDLWEPLAEEREIVLTNQTDRNIELDGNMNLLSQAISNLIDNAIKYGPNGNRINVGAKLEKDHVVLWVSDNGPGILESDKERVLERFTRLDTSRNTQGTGLGLSLVSSSIKFHNGKISLLDSNPNGLIVKLELPKSF
jgi:signal transduction histidine kinase